MQRYRILHRTSYGFSGFVTLGPHYLRLRPREDHELRIESSSLKITPAASLLWHRDVEGNSVAMATFEAPANRLDFESDLIIQQYNQAPLDFLVADYAVNFPFDYRDNDRIMLAPYMGIPDLNSRVQLAPWIANLWHPGEWIQTYSLLQRICSHIHQTLYYQMREAPGVQTPGQTLSYGSGSCRDFATLYMEAARYLGLASRFVSGYLQVASSPGSAGATHAWAEVYLPGPGWKGFDPTIGAIAGPDHIAVAVARSPDAVPPVEGSFLGPPGSSMQVSVQVSRC